MPGRIVNLGLRALQFFWTLLIMALIGNVIHDAFAGNPSIINYTMFISVFAMLSLFYLIAVAWNDGLSGHPAIPLALDVLNVIFFFCGAVAMAADLGVHSCGNDNYTKTNGLINGANNRGKRCHELQAVTAFLWFGFATFVVSMVFSIFGARGGANMRMGGIRKGGPAMSQV